MTAIMVNSMICDKSLQKSHNHAIAAANAATIVNSTDESNNKKKAVMFKKMNQLAQQLLQDIAHILQQAHYAGQHDTTSLVQANPSSPPAVDSILGDLENGLMDISEIMMKMANLIKQIRNIMQNYNAKQQSQEWSIKVASLSKKLESIQDNYNSELISGIVGIIGAAAGGVCGFIGAASNIVSVSELGTMVARGADSAGKTGVAAVSRESQDESVQSDLENSNFDIYRQTESQLLDKAYQQSRSLVSGLESFVGLINQMLSAVKY